MDFWGYLANGGLERLLIIGVATLIGYWGYRIYSRSQTPGLVLIALAAVVLFSVMLTSERHLQSMNANLLAVASLESTTHSAVPETPVALQEDITLVSPGTAPAPEMDQQPIESSAVDQQTAAETIVETETPAASPDQPAPIERLVPLASGQELGGRITSVRSENLTLEWSTDTDNRQIIRPAAPE